MLNSHSGGRKKREAGTKFFFSSSSWKKTEKRTDVDIVSRREGEGGEVPREFSVRGPNFGAAPKAKSRPETFWLGLLLATQPATHS